jgi:hypothetical protein
MNASRRRIDAALHPGENDEFWGPISSSEWFFNWLCGDAQPAHIADVKTTRSYIERDPFLILGVDQGGYRTIVAVPML